MTFIKKFLFWQLRLIAKALLCLLGFGAFCGAMAVLAAYAFCGALILRSVHPMLNALSLSRTSFAVLVAFFALVIEGEVFLQTIASSRQKLKVGRSWLKRQLIKDYLKAQKNNRDAHALCKDYFDLADQLAKLKHVQLFGQASDSIMVFNLKRLYFYVKNFFSWFRQEEEQNRRERIKNIRARLFDIESLYLKAFEDGGSKAITHDAKASIKKEHELVCELKTSLFKDTSFIKLQNKVQIRHNDKIHSLSVFLGICSLYGNIILGHSLIISSLTKVAPWLLTSAAGASIWGIVVLGACAYAYQSYNATLDLFRNETVQKGVSVIRNWRANKWRALGVLVLLSLTVAATVLSGGTAWNYIKTTPKLALIISAVVSVSINTFNFNMANAHESIEELGLDKKLEPKPFVKRCASFFKAILSIGKKDDEGWLEHLIHYPYRLVEAGWQIAVFALHVLSIGITGDRFLSVPPIIAGALGATMEGWVDAHFVIDKLNGDEHEHDDEDDHSHYILNALTGIVKIPLLPVVLLSCLVYTLINNSLACSDSKRKKVGFFSNAKNKVIEFLGIKKVIPATELPAETKLSSNTYSSYSIVKACEKEKSRLDRCLMGSKKIKEKQLALDEFVQQKYAQEIDKSALLNKLKLPRSYSFFSKKEVNKGGDDSFETKYKTKSARRMHLLLAQHNA